MEFDTEDQVLSTIINGLRWLIPLIQLKNITDLVRLFRIIKKKHIKAIFIGKLELLGPLTLNM